MFAATFTVIALFAMWFGMEGARYPFSPNNMYVWELVTIGIGSLFLSLQPNNERIGSAFLTNILTRSAPAAFTQVAAVIVYFVLAFATNGEVIDLQTAITMSILTFSIGSFVILFRICMPFDIYRMALFISLLIIGGIFYAIDINVFYCNTKKCRILRQRPFL